MNLSTQIGLAACVALGAIAPASATHSWGGYHWAGDGQNLTLKINTAITSQWNTSVNGAVADWNTSTG